VSTAAVAIAIGDTITAVVTVTGSQVSGLTLQCDLEINVV
jgi:hypothetical protein